MVERFFRDLTQNRLRRGVFRNLEELIMAIGTYIDGKRKEMGPRDTSLSDHVDLRIISTLSQARPSHPIGRDGLVDQAEKLEPLLVPMPLLSGANPSTTSPSCSGMPTNCPSGCRELPSHAGSMRRLGLWVE